MSKTYTTADNDGRSIFVFGSNTAGIHGAGAAAEAHCHWGAVMFAGIGRHGQSYAIPTKDHNIETLPIYAVQHYVKQFLTYAREHPELRFCITRVGCGLDGFLDSEIAPLFENSPENCELPEGWRK